MDARGSAENLLTLPRTLPSLDATAPPSIGCLHLRHLGRKRSA